MKNKTDKNFWTLTVIGGVIVILVVLLASVKIETNKARMKIHSTINYIKDQYSMYHQFNDATEVKSLMRIIENVQQTGRDLEKDHTEDVSLKERLKRYAKEQKLDGIILLDQENKCVAQYHEGSNFKKVLDYVMQKEVLLDVKKYPQKTYTTRIDLDNGGYIDLAAYGRIDKKGLIAGYQYVKPEYAKNYNLTIQKLLSGYKVDNDGTIVLTSGNKIIASNEQKLINTKVPDQKMILKIRDRKSVV